jgi:hypothetical protein
LKHRLETLNHRQEASTLEHRQEFKIYVEQIMVAPTLSLLPVPSMPRGLEHGHT